VPVVKIEVCRARPLEQVTALIEAVSQAQLVAFKLPEDDKQIRYIEHKPGYFPVPPGKTEARIGFLSFDRAGNPRSPEAFVQGLRDLGYAEGRNVVIEYRDADGKTERLPALAAELVALNVDVIVAPSLLAALAAGQATGTIPILFAGVADPVTDGLVASLARPGGNT